MARYALKQAKRIIVNDIKTKEHKMTMVQLKTVDFKGASNVQYATGADGARLAAFDSEKTFQITATSGVISSGVLEAQTGGSTVEVTNGTDVLLTDEFTIGENTTTVTLSHKAAGTAGTEIKWIYKEDSTGDPVKSYAQGATASATQFAYAPETKEITLPTGIFTAGDVVRIDYHPTFSKYTELSNDADKFGVTGEVIVEGWFRDLCSGEDKPLQLYTPNGKVSGEFTWTFGTDAATQNITIDSLVPQCAGQSKSLFKLRTFDLQDIVDT